MRDNVAILVRDMVQTEVVGRLDALHSFVERKFAELSAELHATVELAEFTENNLAAQIAAVHGEISALVAAPVANTHNSGHELAAVVVDTEVAANNIMEAAEAISGWANSLERDPAELQRRVNAIFEACSFQDLTGQRVRRAIDHLRSVETMLQEMAASGTAMATALPLPSAVTSTGGTGTDIAQSEIDRLMDF